MDRIANGEDININVDTKDFIAMVDSVNALRRGDIDKVKHMRLFSLMQTGRSLWIVQNQIQMLNVY